MVRRVKKYGKLKSFLSENGIRQSELCEELKKSQTWLTNRMSSERDGCFTIDEGYAILEILNIPVTEFTTYFPRGGYVN